MLIELSFSWRVHFCRDGYLRVLHDVTVSISHARFASIVCYYL
jgi:hypothetical protein